MPSCRHCHRPGATAEFRRSPKGDGSVLCKDKTRCAHRRAAFATEAQLQSALIDAAMVRGYLVQHVRPAQTAKGWRTPVEGDKGFPDLVLARRGSLFMWELKGMDGELAVDQVRWQEALAPGFFNAGVITPLDQDRALAALEAGYWS